jgi:predicted nucleic acid-binding protein
MFSETSTARLQRSRQIAGSGSLSQSTEVEPPSLDRPALLDTGVWTWVRDRRFPQLASWFNAQVASGRVLVCDLVILELVRLAPNKTRARDIADRLDAFESLPMPAALWSHARRLQASLAANDGDHRRVPPVDLLIGAAAEAAGVPLLHYDRDYERIARVSALEHRWLVPDGTLA